jgi:hypothetical protein
MVLIHHLEQAVLELYVRQSGTLLVAEARKSVGSKHSLYGWHLEDEQIDLIYMCGVHV